LKTLVSAGVLFSDGTIPISDIREGDTILAYNEATGEVDEYTA